MIIKIKVISNEWTVNKFVFLKKSKLSYITKKLNVFEWINKSISKLIDAWMNE